jgi:thiol-disulfide isomerase/thioredoxin
VRRTLAVLTLIATPAFATLIKDVRGAIDHGEFSHASELIRDYRAANGVTPEMIEALSWMGRGELGAKNYDEAEKYAEETYALAVAATKKTPLDSDKNLPIGLGAAIEVEANVLAARNQRTEAITYLQDQLKRYYATSIRTRIQKNINLLTMEGKPAPALENVSLPKNTPALLFFWAHWCPDCKNEVPILAKIKAEFEPRGLVLISPTQKYGFVGRGENATPEVELAFIEKIRRERYAEVIPSPAPVSEDNFRRYGASTTPTLVLVDRSGIVRLYHPGAMTYEELRQAVESVVSHSARASGAY